MATELPEPVQAAALAAAAAQADRSAVVAELTEDSPLPGAAATLSRRLTFNAPSVRLVVDVVWADDGYHGELRTSPGRAVVATVHSADSAVGTTSLGADGGPIGALPAGPCRLTLVSAEETVETEWVTLPRPQLDR